MTSKTTDESPNHSFTEAEAERLAMQLYGLRGRACSLPGEFDDNFHFIADDRTEFVLKVMHADRERALLELQCEALVHLAKNSPSLLLPSVCPTQNGEWIVAVNDSYGTERLVWLLNYVPGVLFAEVNPHTPELLFSLGAFLGRIDASLEGFSHPAAQRELKWDLARAGWVKEHLDCIEGESRRAMITRLLHRYEAAVIPQLPTLRRSVIHNDANDYNVIVNDAKTQLRQVVSVIDFGDMLHTCTVFEVAIAAAYALLGKPDPLASAARVVAGYHQAHPLAENEIALLYDLICSRLMVSVVNSGRQKQLFPDDPYITISARPTHQDSSAFCALHFSPGLRPGACAA
jgi:Ser/Thr protein kinase RdoA (MazF antagonist)